MNGATIELSGIGTSLDDSMIMNMFRTYGPITRVTHNGSNSAQVVFERKNHAKKAVEATNGAVVFGKTLKASLQRQFKNANQPCRGFAAGICRKGDMCKYQHVTDTAEFAPPMAPPTVQRAKREPKKKAKKAPEPAVVPPEIKAIPDKQVCRYFLRGYCSKGVECTFAHVSGLPKPEAPVPTGKVYRPCLFFQSGVCTRGDECRFVHEPKASAAPVEQSPVKTAPVKTPAKEVPAKKAAAKPSISGAENETEPQHNGETRICVECEKPGVAVWKCSKCDNSLYCEDCNSAVHSARVMAKHKRSKLPSVPKLPRCGECESNPANVRCEQCEVPFCASCDGSVHKFKSLQKHIRVKLSAKSEKTKPKANDEPKAAKKQEKKKQVERPAPANPVPYVESVPMLAFSSDSESDDEDMSEASSVQQHNDDDEPMPEVADSSDTETDDDFDDVKPQSSVSVPVTPTPVVKEQTSESESDEDFDDKPAAKPTPSPKMELSSDSESEDDSEDEAPATKPASAPASKPTLAELSSESEADSDDEVSSTPAVKLTPKPASKPVAKTKPTPAAKPAMKKAVSKSSSSDSSSSDSSDSEDEAPPTKPVAKPTPAPRRAPAPARNNKTAGISDGSSHTLVKKIEAFNVSGEGDKLHLDANLNGFERLLAHDCAERLGLAHESTGDGLERHIIISRHSSKRVADSSIGRKSKKSKHH